jgi:hypothetical protein
MKRTFIFFACPVLLLSTTSCTQSGESREKVGPAPLSTIANGPVVCGLFPEATISLLFHGIPNRAHTTFGPYRNSDGSLSGNSCEVIETEDKNEETLVDATVTHGFNEEVLRSAYTQKTRHLAYFPSDLGPGYAQYRDDVDVKGRGRKIAAAGIQWGDYSIVVVIYKAAPGRVLLNDAVALTQQIGFVLKLPKEPSKPYPKMSDLPS